MKQVIAERGEFYDRSVKSSGKLVAKQFDMYMQKKGFSGTGISNILIHLNACSSIRSQRTSSSYNHSN